jgi:hypothetical protein
MKKVIARDRATSSVVRRRSCNYDGEPRFYERRGYYDGGASIGFSFGNRGWVRPRRRKGRSSRAAFFACAELGLPGTCERIFLERELEQRSEHSR